MNEMQSEYSLIFEQRQERQPSHAPLLCKTSVIYLPGLSETRTTVQNTPFWNVLTVHADDGLVIKYVIFRYIIC